MLSGRISAGRLLFSSVPRPRTVVTWGTFFKSSSRLAICWLSKSSVIIMEKAPLPNSSRRAF